MKSNSPPQIRINSVGERYVATFESEFLDATYALVFRETVNGAVALHRFAKMIELAVVPHHRCISFRHHLGLLGGSTPGLCRRSL